MKPLVKWLGGKRLLAPNIASHLSLEKARSYHEPFAGGAAVFCEVHDRYPELPAHLSDITPRLMNLYTWVKTDVRAVQRELNRITALVEDQLKTTSGTDVYLQVREAFNRDKDKWSAAQAATLLWISKACFNGLYRENQKGLFNAHVGTHLLENRPAQGVASPEDLQEWNLALQNTELNCEDFRLAMNRVGTGDVAYLDPPYVPSGRPFGGFVSYGALKFAPASQADVIASAAEAAGRGALVAVSNHASAKPAYEAAGFHVAWEGDAARRVSRKGDGRQPDPEILMLIGAL